MLSNFSSFKIFYLPVIFYLFSISTVYSQNPEWIVYDSSNSGLPHNIVTSIAIDDSVNKWIGTHYGGLAKFDGTKWDVYSGFSSDHVNSLAIDESDNKWVGTMSGLAKFDGVTWTVYLKYNSGLPDDYINSITIDDSETKWIGTFNGGLAKFDDTSWTVYDTTNAILSNNVNSVTTDDSGTIWIGMYPYQYYDTFGKFDGKSWTFYNRISSCVNYISIDGFGNKWIGTGGGLVKYNDTSWTHFNTQNSGIPSNEVNFISIDDSGNKWIGTKKGLAKYDDTSWTVYDTSNSSLPANNVSSIAFDPLGNMWIGTYRGGLAVYKEGGVVAVKEKKPSVSRIPLKISLHRNASITRIPFSVLKPSHVLLKVFDIKGRIIQNLVDDVKRAGNHQVDFDCRNISNGTYFIHLRVGINAVTKKMVVLE